MRKIGCERRSCIFQLLALVLMAWPGMANAQTPINTVCKSLMEVVHIGARPPEDLVSSIPAAHSLVGDDIAQANTRYSSNPSISDFTHQIGAIPETSSIVWLEAGVFGYVRYFSNVDRQIAQPFQIIPSELNHSENILSKVDLPEDYKVPDKYRTVKFGTFERDNVRYIYELLDKDNHSEKLLIANWDKNHWIEPCNFSFRYDTPLKLEASSYDPIISDSDRRQLAGAAYGEAASLQELERAAGTDAADERQRYAKSRTEIPAAEDNPSTSELVDFSPTLLGPYKQIRDKKVRLIDQNYLNGVIAVSGTGYLDDKRYDGWLVGLWNLDGSKPYASFQFVRGTPRIYGIDDCQGERCEGSVE